MDTGILHAPSVHIRCDETIANRAAHGSAGAKSLVGSSNELHSVSVLERYAIVIIKIAKMPIAKKICVSCSQCNHLVQLYPTDQVDLFFNTVYIEFFFV